MSMSRGQREAKRKARQRLARSKAKSVSRRRWGMVARTAYYVAFALVSWAASLMIFKPVVGIDVFSNRDDASAVRLQVANNSTFSIYNVRTRAILTGTFYGVRYNNVGRIGKPNIVPEIESGTKPAQFVLSFRDLPLELPFGPMRDTDQMKMNVVTTFRASFTWWDTKRERPFVAMRVRDGVEWVEIPPD